jgi:hypothetical protein
MKKYALLALALLFSIISEEASAQAIGPIYCSQAFSYDSAAIQTLRGIIGISGSKAYICGFDATGGTGQSIQLVTGTGTNCGTNTQNLTPAFQAPAFISIGGGGQTWEGLGPVPPLVDVCIKTTAAVSTQVLLYFNQQ